MAVLRPQVRVKTQENIQLIAPTGPGTVSIIGTAQWGPIDELKSFTSTSQMLDIYKPDASGLTGSIMRCAEILFLNGAANVKVIRIAASGSKVLATKDFDGAGPTVGVLTFDAVYYGSFGNNILVTILAKGTGRTVEITDGEITEVFDNSGDANGYATNAAIGTAINDTNTGSTLVDVTVKAGSETSNLVDAASQTALAGGKDGVSGLADADYTTAFDNFLNTEFFDILLTPEQTGDAFHTTMVGKLNTRATAEKKFSVYLTGIAKDETITTQKARVAAGNRLCVVSPNIKRTLSYNNTLTILDGTYLAAAVAGIVAGNDVEIPATRKTLNVEGLSILESTKSEVYNNAELEELLSARILPCNLINNALKVVRSITRSADKTSVFFELSIRRIVDLIQAQVEVLADGFIGELNNDRIRKVLASVIDSQLEQDARDEIINDFIPTTVEEGSSPDTVIVGVTVRPVFGINFINVTIAISNI